MAKKNGRSEWMSNVLAAGGKLSDSDIGVETSASFGFTSEEIEHNESEFGKWRPFRGRLFKKIARPFASLGKVVGEAGKDISHGKFNRAFHAVGRATMHSNEIIGRNLRKIPAVGPALSSVYTITVAPIDLSSRIARGTRIDKAFGRTFKEQVKAYQDIAPYVQMVVSNIPGLGTGVAAAIGAAVALSKGRPITDALLEAAKGAIPGGPAAQAAFSTAVAGIQGKPIDQIALAALPIDDTQKKLLSTAVNSAKALAEGKRVDEVAMHAAMDQLPPDLHKAVQVGVALAQGQKLQKVMADGVAGAVPTLVNLGAKQAADNPVFKAGADTLKHDPTMLRGYHMGLGFLQHKVNPTALITIRKGLSPQALKGFDIAASAKVGQVAKPLPKKIPPAQRFGYYVLHGMHGNIPQANAAMMKTLVVHPEVKAGAVAAAKEVTQLNAPKVSWIHKVLRVLHIEKIPPQLPAHS